MYRQASGNWTAGIPGADKRLQETGNVNYREHLVDGLENTVESFIGLLEGKNFGKLVMRVGPDEL